MGRRNCARAFTRAQAQRSSHDHESPEKSSIIVTETAPAKAGFASFGFGQSIQRGIEAAGYVDPRPIQDETIPAVLNGRDVLGLAQTGTGKTAAFALPIIEGLLANKRRGPSALVIAPTRELAMQIHSEFESLGKFTRVRATTVYGGVSMGRQIKALRSRPDIIVACPGRLLDLYGQGYLNLDNIDTVVLDEADNMFDMGFLPDIRRILDAVPDERQTLLFSATMPKEVRHLADGILREPVVVELNHSQPISTIAHELFPIHRDRKFELLEHLIGSDGFSSAIVFMRTKRRALRIGQQLARAGHDAVALQGNMSQAQRDRAMKGFRTGKFNILVATDIAARGIDVANISHVINFDMPDTPDAYTHRIGRTGRAEQTGKAYTFVTTEDFELVYTLERKLGTNIPRCQLVGFEGTEIPDAPARRTHGRRSGAPSRASASKPRARAPQRRQRPAGPGSSAGERNHRSSNGFEARNDSEAPRQERSRPEGGSSYTDRRRPSRDSYRDRNEDRGPRRERPQFEGEREFGGRREESRPRRGYASRGPRDERGFSDRREDSRPPRGGASRGPRDGRGFSDRREDSRPPRGGSSRGPRDERGFSDRREDSRPPRGGSSRGPRDERGYSDRREDSRPPRGGASRGPRDERGFNDRREDSRPPRGGASRGPRDGRDFSDRREGFKPRRGPTSDRTGGNRDFEDRKPRRDRDAAPANNYDRADRPERREDRPKRKTGPGAPARKGSFSGTPRAKGAGTSRPRKRTRK